MVVVEEDVKGEEGVMVMEVVEEEVVKVPLEELEVKVVFRLQEHFNNSDVGVGGVGGVGPDGPDANCLW